MYKRLVPYLQLCLAAIIIGSSVVAGKLLSSGFPIFLSQALCLVIAASVLFPAARWLEGGLSKIRPRDLGLLFLQAFSGLFLFRVFLLYGLKYTSATESGIITSSTPAAVVILSFIFLKERISWNKIAGTAATVSGILVINLLGLSSDSPTNASSLTGNLLILLAVICEASLVILRKFNSVSVPPVTGAAFVALFSFFLFLPFAVREGAAFDIRSLSLSQGLLIAYYGLVVTALAYILWFSGVSKVPASTAAVYTGCIPVSSILLSSLFLKEAFTGFHLAGICLVLAGILFISLSRPRD